MAFLINGLLIFAAGAVVVVVAIQLPMTPVPVVAALVAWAAAAGIAIKLLCALLFGHDHQHALNQRAAVLPLPSEAAVSLAVLLRALLVWATGGFWLDALTALGVGAAVDRSGMTAPGGPECRSAAGPGPAPVAALGIHKSTLQLDATGADRIVQPVNPRLGLNPPHQSPPLPLHEDAHLLAAITAWEPQPAPSEPAHPGSPSRRLPRVLPNPRSSSLEP